MAYLIHLDYKNVTEPMKQEIMRRRETRYNLKHKADSMKEKAYAEELKMQDENDF